jgi:hypothetical protein
MSLLYTLPFYSLSVQPGRIFQANYYENYLSKILGLLVSRKKDNSKLCDTYCF